MSDHLKPARPVVLIIRDGWGRNPHPEHDAFNAIKLAHKPVDDMLIKNWPNTLIKTSGEDVGLPAGTMGNSEVGHQNIGAGRIVDQELMRITRSIRSGAFFENKSLRNTFEYARHTGGAVHVMGLVSNGCVHSSMDHLFALIELASKLQFPADKLFIHAFTDGRDTGPMTGLGFIAEVEKKCAATGVGRIASVCGRYWAMDRDHRWDRIARAYQCLTGRAVKHDGEPVLAPATAKTAIDAVQRYYDHPANDNMRGDEFITPTQIVDSSDKPVGIVRDNDAVIFFNFRGDRPRELTKAFMLDEAQWKQVPRSGFDRSAPIENLHFCTMTGYEQGLPVSAIVFEKPPKMINILGEVVSAAGLTQFRCAETEKFAHVTFFFNDYRETPFDGETRVLVPSPTDVATYDQKPEMSAPGVCNAVLERLNADDCEQLIVVNFANGDMVGHTGVLNAAIKAVETVDECVGKIVAKTLERGGSLIITADHGNAEQMWNPETNAPHTAHTTYDVPLIVVGDSYRGRALIEDGRLADIAPTVLAMIGLAQPAEMMGRILFESSGAARTARHNAAQRKPAGATRRT